MRRQTVVRSAVAVIAALGIGVGLVPAVGGAATAAASGEVVFHGDVGAQPRTVIPLAAGPTGFLRYEEGRGQFWSTYSGTDRVIYNDLEGPEADGSYGAGSDVVAAYKAYGEVDPGRVRLYDVPAGRNSYVDLPAGHTYVGTFGTTVATYSRTSASAAPEWHLLTLVSGAVHDTKVVGWPQAADRPVKAVTGSADGILVQYEQGGRSRPSWISLPTGEVHPVAPDATAGSVSSAVTPGHVVEWTQDGKVTFYATNGSRTPGPLVADRVVNLPHATGDRLLGVTGERLVVARKSAPGGPTPYRIVTASLDGGAESTLFAHARGDAMPTPDGGLLVVAGSSPDALGVQLIHPGGSDPTVSKLKDVTPATSRPRQLSFSQGRLESLEVLPDQRNAFRSRTVSVTGELATEPPGTADDRGMDLSGCTDVQGCPDVFATGDGRSVIQRAPNGGGDQMPLIVERDGSEATELSVPGLVSFAVADVSGRYATGAGRDSSGEDTGLIVVDLDTSTRTARVNLDVWDSDLYGDTVWGAGPKNGTVVGYDARTGAVGRTVDLGTGCRAESVKVTSHWLSWDCAGTPARGGVFDLDKNTHLTFTDHPISVLGDGYVAWGNYPDVNITDVRGASPVSAGTYRMSDDGERESQSAIDTAAGRIAYQREGGDIAIADLGIPASPLARIDSDVPSSAAVKGGASSWAPRWWLSKPASSWQLTLKNRATGATVRTLAGGEARGLVTADWNGKDAAGQLAANGAYTWTLTANPADGQGAALTTSGTVDLSGAAAVPRDFVGNDGFGDLLAFTPAGVADWRAGTGTGTGRVETKVSGSGWTGANTVTASVPFEDVSGDRCNDVLVRMKTGELRTYKPACGAALKPTTPYTKIGTGWNMFDALTSPGDLTGDGRADLLARTPAGDLYLYTSRGDGFFEPRVKIGYGWQKYLLAGMGDLDGDGKGDLLARDGSGVVWRYPATGKGTLGTRAKVGYGWTMYDSMVGSGDLNGDGRADLLARDTSGALWSYRGDGKGGLAARVKVGGGWQMYARLS